MTSGYSSITGLPLQPPSRKGAHLTAEQCARRSANNGRYWLGRKRPEITRWLKGFPKGNVPWNKGRTPKAETPCLGCGALIVDHKWRHRTYCTKSCANSKANNGFWKGGITTPERKAFLQRRRDVRKIANGGTHSLEQWVELKALFRNQCLSCHRPESEIKLTEDHVLPIAKGGTDSIDNIQPLCMRCNRKKHLALIDYRPVTLAALKQEWRQMQ
jgi:5-methylcytosine-specific restriction endonuclease McrA